MAWKISHLKKVVVTWNQSVKGKGIKELPHCKCTNISNISCSDKFFELLSKMSFLVEKVKHNFSRQAQSGNFPIVSPSTILQTILFILLSVYLVRTIKRWFCFRAFSQLIDRLPGPPLRRFSPFGHVYLLLNNRKIDPLSSKFFWKKVNGFWFKLSFFFLRIFRLFCLSLQNVWSTRPLAVPLLGFSHSCGGIL